MQPAGPPSSAQMKDMLDKYHQWVIDNPDINRNRYLDDLTKMLINKQTQQFADDVYHDMIKDLYSKKVDQTMTTAETKSSKFEDHEIVNIKSLKTLAWGKWGALQSLMPSASIIENNLVIAGGCFTSWFHGDEPKDIDVFFYGDDDQRDYFATLLERLNNTHPCVRSQYNVNNNQITDVYNELSGFQFILTKYKTREEIIKHFDYAHCMVSFDGEKLYISRETYDAIKKKHLIVNNQERVAEWRTAKFLARGFVDPTVPHDRGMSWQSAARINPVRKMKTTPMIDPWFPA